MYNGKVERKAAFTRLSCWLEQLGMATVESNDVAFPDAGDAICCGSMSQK